MITLTNDQQNALDKFHVFLTDPVETVFVLSGHSGTGKTTLIKTLLAGLPAFLQTVHLINPDYPEYEVKLTATTNKAAEAMSGITGVDVATIHSFLGLRVQTDYTKNITTLIPRSSIPKENVLLFIDEASYVDRQLLGYVFSLTRKCKIVFMGDPAQLTPVKATGTPVFDAGFSGAQLSQVVRQAAGNPIVDLSTKFRETVGNGQFFSFIPDGHHIQYMERGDFNQAIETEFTRSDWRHDDSKILAWTNKCVIGFNSMVRNQVKGDPEFQVGDYAVVNSFTTIGKDSLKTDQLVQITNIQDTNRNGLNGRLYELDHRSNAFMPNSLAEKNLAIKQARARDDIHAVSIMESQWVDLRAAYACTINKAQGSTYDKVFIDLDDVRRCNSGNQIARMLYVAVSRARHQVILTGDIC